MDINMDSKLTRRDWLENLVNTGSPSSKSCPLTTPEMQTAGASMERLLPLPLLLWGKKVDNPVSGQPNQWTTQSRGHALSDPSFGDIPESAPTNTRIWGYWHRYYYRRKNSEFRKILLLLHSDIVFFFFFLNLANYPKKASYTNLYNTLNISQY